MNVSDKDLREALDRVARTADGELLYLYFQRVLCEIATDSESRPLSEHHGRRKFAAELMALMTEGIEQSGRSGSRPVTFAVAGSKSVAKPVSRRRVGPDTFIPAWNDGPDPQPDI